MCASPNLVDGEAELSRLRAKLVCAQRERAAAALDAGRRGQQPGEALQRFLAADAEVAAFTRRIRRIVSSVGGGLT